jgi:outer membrane protein OmpA-like peptidoglycan-associated protein
LLAPDNGTIDRSYPAGVENPDRVAVYGATVPDGTKPPYVFVFELPGVASIASFNVHLRAVAEGKTPTATVAISTTSATDGFRDVGTATAKTDEVEQVLPENVTARWVRVTVSEGGQTAFDGISALGTLQPRPATAPSPDGIFVEADPYKPDDGTFAPDPGTSANPWYVHFAMAPAIANGPAGMSGTRCYDGRLGDAYPGTFDGRYWTWSDSTESSKRLVVNDEGTMIVRGDTWYVRTARTPKFCEKQDGGGKGPANVLVLDASNDFGLYPLGDSANDAVGIHFDREEAAMLTPSDLAQYPTIMLNGLCIPTDFLSAPIGAALANWILAGHKLLIYDADMCNHNVVYPFLPYQFTSNNPGAQGAKGNRLIEVENDQLGSLEASDKTHFFDPQPFATGNNQLGDANTVVSQDPHWCGHLFGTNVSNVNGFMQMYAVDGKGLIVYDGFDHDDGGNPYYQRIRLLELAASVDGNNPCSQSVALSFLIEPDQAATFVPGKAVTMKFPMELLANQGWKGHVNLTTTGDFPGSVMPSALDVNGGTTPLSVAVRIPASAKPGQYAVLVNGDGGTGKPAQATITFEAAVPIVKQLKIQRRIRLYGIHFDVDSARIQPRSEPVIKEVAEILRSEPGWRFRIEGHTDSDGGVAHNQVLSQHRAQSVVDDLVKRYHIARSRLVPVGYGLSRPVASNATPAGKALNRRVELVRL